MASAHIHSSTNNAQGVGASLPLDAAVPVPEIVCDPLSSSFPLLTPGDLTVVEHVIQNGHSASDAYALSIAKQCAEHGNFAAFFPHQSNENATLAGLSATAQQLVGARPRLNTERNTRNAMKQFSLYLVENLNLFTTDEIALAKNRRALAAQRNALTDKATSLTHVYLFMYDKLGLTCPRGTVDWPDCVLQRVNKALIEFVAYVRNSMSGDELAPTTLVNYVIGIQRAFRDDWKYDLNLMEGHVFGDKNTGIATVLDNKVRALQAAGFVKASHNILSAADIRKLYQSPKLSRDHPRSFMTRLILDLAFMTAFRPGEMYDLRMKDVELMTDSSEPFFQIRGRIGSIEGASKASPGGRKHSGVKAKTVHIWNRDQLGGLVNVFQDLLDYINAVKQFRGPNDRLFASIKYGASVLDDFFKNCNLGESQFGALIKDACNYEGITGVGVRKEMTMHGLRGTVITQLFEAGYAAPSVVLRSGHACEMSLHHYQTPLGALGKRMQLDTFGDIEEPATQLLRIENPRTGMDSDADPIITHPDEENGATGSIPLLPSTSDMARASPEPTAAAGSMHPNSLPAAHSAAAPIALPVPIPLPASTGVSAVGASVAGALATDGAIPGSSVQGQVNICPQVTSGGGNITVNMYYNTAPPPRDLDPGHHVPSHSTSVA